MIVLATLGKYEQMWRNWSFLCLLLRSFRPLSQDVKCIQIFYSYFSLFSQNESFIASKCFLSMVIKFRAERMKKKTENVRIVLKEGEKLQECEFVFVPYEFHSWLQDCHAAFSSCLAPCWLSSLGQLHVLDRTSIRLTSGSAWLLQYRHWGYFWSPAEPTASLWKLT